MNEVTANQLSALAMICIASCVIVALLKGINGVILAGALALIAGIAGYKFGSARKQDEKG